MALPATQKFLQFDQIRDGVIVLKGGDLRMILMVSSVNFALKSQDEQEAMIAGFQGFLNSLDFDLQIVIHSRRMNIHAYLSTLRDLAEAQEKELLRTQTLEYIEFVKNFIASVNVMSKTFYVVVPYSTKTAQEKENPLKALATLLPAAPRPKIIELDAEKFNFYRTEMMQRVEFVTQGLHAMGVRATPLTTTEVAELLWELYNPGKSDVEEMPPPIEEDILARETVV